MACRSEPHARLGASTRAELGGDADLIDLVGRILATAARQCPHAAEPPPAHGKRKTRTDLWIRWAETDE